MSIHKLITDEEIEQNQSFFEEYAKEYGRLGEELINQFIEKFNVKPHNGFPLKTINAMGQHAYLKPHAMGEWNYFFHGFHCRFTHKKTKQQIEVPLTFGEEFGELDPFFFIIFIWSTPKFKPLPIEIYPNVHDGLRILEVMLRLGKFEKVNSNFKGQSGIIVTDRVKKEVKVFDTGMEAVLNEVFET